MNFVPFFSYVLVSTFTPGPANISSASSGVLHGYIKTLSYQLGLAVGVFILMLLIGWVSILLVNVIPAVEPVLRLVGAAYILYLAYSILKAGYGFTAKESKPLGFGHGLLLQVLNVKLLVYAFTVFSGFVAPLPNSTSLVAPVALGLAVISFVSTTLWALFGTAIKTFLHNPRWVLVVNILLALSLVYAAISLIGIL